jgi:hypothetical protein
MGYRTQSLTCLPSQKGGLSRNSQNRVKKIINTNTNKSNTQCPDGQEFRGYIRGLA